MKCLSVLVLFVLYSICSAEFTAEDEILAKCKYIQCKNMADLQKEVDIRQCVVTTCRSKAIARAGLVGACKASCIEEIEKHPAVVPADSIIYGEKPSTILDYAWLD